MAAEPMYYIIVHIILTCDHTAFPVHDADDNNIAAGGTSRTTFGYINKEIQSRTVRGARVCLCITALDH
jgi:hypothetical protein